MVVPFHKYETLTKAYEKEEKADKWFEAIKENLQDRDRRQGLALLHYLPLKWTREGHVVLSDSHIVTGTSTKYLVQQEGTAKTEGVTFLYSILAELDTPLNLIGNSCLKQRIKALRNILEHMEEEGEDDSEEMKFSARFQIPFQTLFLTHKQSQNLQSHKSSNTRTLRSSKTQREKEIREKVGFTFKMVGRRKIKLPRNVNAYLASRYFNPSRAASFSGPQ